MTDNVTVPIQNFSVPADNDVDVYVTVKTALVGDSLSGNTIYWRAFEQQAGNPLPGIPPVIVKTSLSGGGIEILESPPMTFVISINRGDVLNLLRNYYHESTIVDVLGNVNTVECGIMTVIATENRIV